MKREELGKQKYMHNNTGSLMSCSGDKVDLRLDGVGHLLGRAGVAAGAAAPCTVEAGPTVGEN